MHDTGCGGKLFIIICIIRQEKRLRSRQSSNGNLCHPQQGATWNINSVCIYIYMVLDCALYYTVNHQNTYSTLPQFCNFPSKINVSATWNCLGHHEVLVHRRTMQSVSHHPLRFCTEHRQPAGEKRHSQLLRMQFIKSNLLTSSIAFEWTRRSPVEEKKMTACGQSARWRHRSAHLCQLRQSVYIQREGRTKVLWWVAVAVELSLSESRSFYKQMKKCVTP